MIKYTKKELEEMYRELQDSTARVRSEVRAKYKPVIDQEIAFETRSLRKSFAVALVNSGLTRTEQQEVLRTKSWGIMKELIDLAGEDKPIIAGTPEEPLVKVQPPMDITPHTTVIGAYTSRTAPDGTQLDEAVTVRLKDFGEGDLRPEIYSPESGGATTGDFFQRYGRKATENWFNFFIDKHRAG